MASYHCQLLSMPKREKKTFKEYTQCWREFATQAEPSIVGKELNIVFMDTLQPLYWERIIGVLSSIFVDLVTFGDMVEKSVRTGKIIVDVELTSGPKRFLGNHQRKKEGDTNSIYNRRKGPCQQYVCPSCACSSTSTYNV